MLVVKADYFMVNIIDCMMKCLRRFSYIALPFCTLMGYNINNLSTLNICITIKGFEIVLFYHCYKISSHTYLPKYHKWPFHRVLGYNIIMCCICISQDAILTFSNCITTSETTSTNRMKYIIRFSRNFHCIYRQMYSGYFMAMIHRDPPNTVYVCLYLATPYDFPVHTTWDIDCYI